MKKGATRYVYFAFGYALKIPSLYSWENFLWGLLANMNEVKFSKCVEMKDRLCPVVFSLPFGLMVVMPKIKIAEPGELTEWDINEVRIGDKFTIPVESKHDSFGYYKGKLVAVDYG